MISMQTEQLNLKLQKGLYHEIEIVSKILQIPKNEWARNVLAHEIKKELEEYKQFIVRAYMKGAITKKELTEILSKKEIEAIERILKTGRNSLDDAPRLTHTMR